MQDISTIEANKHVAFIESRFKDACNMIEFSHAKETTRQLVKKLMLTYSGNQFDVLLKDLLKMTGHANIELLLKDDSGETLQKLIAKKN